MLEISTKNDAGFLYDKSLLEQGVEFIGLINKQGRMESTLFKNEMNLTKEKKDMFLMGLRLQNTMQSDYDDEFGPVSYTITERENSKFVSIPSFPHIILAIMKKNKGHIAVINKIKIAIRDFEKVRKELPAQESDQV